MPLTMPRRHAFVVDWLLIMVGAGFVALGGWHVAEDISHPGAATVVTLTRNGTSYVTETRTVKRVVRGKVHTLPGHQVVVRVPLIVVHTDHHVIKVPAHDVPIKSASAAIAMPNVPVTVYVTVPAEPVTVTSTVVSTVVSTDIVPTTITVTVPLEGGGPDT